MDKQKIPPGPRPRVKRSKYITLLCIFINIFLILVCSMEKLNASISFFFRIE